MIDKIRPAAARRYGPEWYVIKMAQTVGALTESQLIGGVAHGLVNVNANVALPNKFTIGDYVKVKTGSAAVRVNSVRVVRASTDGTPVAAGQGASPVALTNADGWKYVDLECTPNQYNYDNTAFQLLASAGAELLFRHAENRLWPCRPRSQSRRADEREDVRIAVASVLLEAAAKTLGREGSLVQPA